MRDHEFARLIVSEVIHETDSAVSVVLDIPDADKARFAYQPGQFLTIHRQVQGQRRTRCYSLSSSPHVDRQHAITIKRVAGGLVSNDLCANLQPGDVLESAPPGGVFVPKSLDGDFILFAGGSGITPVMSIAKSALREGKGKIRIVYANQNENSVIFRDALKRLAEEHADRLTVIHWLESVQGLPSVNSMKALLGARPSAMAFMCGPQPFMTTVTESLLQLGMDRSAIHAERFVSLPDEEIEQAPSAAEGAAASASVPLRVLMDGTEHQIDWRASDKLLDAMLAAGIDAPYSCRLGGCSTCMCRLVSGQVDMSANLVLDAQELADGWVLSCQATQKGGPVSVEIAS